MTDQPRYGFRAKAVGNIIEPFYGVPVCGRTRREHMDNHIHGQTEPTHFAGMDYNKRILWQSVVPIESLEYADTPKEAWEQFREAQKQLMPPVEHPVKRYVKLKYLDLDHINIRHLIEIQVDESMPANKIVDTITSAARQARAVHKSLDIEILCDILEKNGFPAKPIVPIETTATIIL